MPHGRTCDRWRRLLTLCLCALLSGAPSVRQVRNHFDAETEVALRRWVAAKRKQDFAKADEIRAELAAKGIDADKERPAKRPKQRPPPP